MFYAAEARTVQQRVPLFAIHLQAERWETDARAAAPAARAPLFLLRCAHTPAFFRFSGALLPPCSMFSARARAALMPATMPFAFRQNKQQGARYSAAAALFLPDKVAFAADTRRHIRYPLMLQRYAKILPPPFHQRSFLHG